MMGEGEYARLVVGEVEAEVLGRFCASDAANRVLRALRLLALTAFYR